MNPSGFVAELRRRGFTLFPRGDKLVCRGPTEALTESVLEAMRQQKPAILRLLAAEEAEYHALLERGLIRCWRCKRILVGRHVEPTESPRRFVCRDLGDCREAQRVAAELGVEVCGYLIFPATPDEPEETEPADLFSEEEQC